MAFFLSTRNSAWLNRYQAASFRGVPFFVDSHNASYGRRLVVHEYPERDKPFTEDMGPVSRRFSVTGHVIGDDYFTDRDRLIAAVNNDQPGELVHPYLGSLQVRVENFRITENKNKGRMADITFEFVEAGEVKFPVQADDAKDGLFGAAADVLGEAESQFGTLFDVLTKPQFVIDAARDAVENVASTIENVTQATGANATGLTDLAFALRNLRADVNNLIRSPSTLASRFRESLQLLTEVFTGPEEQRRAFKRFNEQIESTFTPVPNATRTPSRLQQQTNDTATIELTRIISNTERAKAAIEGDFVSVDEAVAERVEITEEIERESNLVNISENQFQNLRDLNANLVEALPLQNLARVVTFDNSVTRPALVIAYDLFEDADKEQDIIDRNSIRHPGFVPGGETIEVLSG